MSDLKNAAQLYKSGQKDEARRVVGALLKREPENDEAWYYAAMLSDAPEQRAKFLQKALDLNPFHERANAALDKLQAAGKTPRSSVTASGGTSARAAKSGGSGMMIGAITLAALLLVGMVAYGVLTMSRGAATPAAQVVPTSAVLSAADFAATGTAVAASPGEPTGPQATAIPDVAPTTTPTPAPFQVTATAYLHAAQTADAGLRLTATAAAGG